MSPIIKQGIFSLIYSTFLHNSEVIALFLAAIFTLVLLFRKPSRFYLLFFVGFSLLLVRIEYLKHIVDPLQKQTQAVVVQESGHFRARRIIDVFLNDILPFVMYVAGWFSIFWGLLIYKGKKAT